MPRLPLLALSPTVVLTLVATFDPAVFTSLRRDPSALAEGEVWRLLSPLLVQADALADGGGWRTIAVFALVAAILGVGERTFGAARALVLYLVGALVGHGVGELWQPYSAGCSVAGCGLLGGVAVWLLGAQSFQLKLGAAMVLTMAVVGTLLEDIHGPPVLAGAALGAWLAHPKRRDPDAHGRSAIRSPP
jgi:rhomboid protease GluP